jgi:hypothetical protein
MCGDQRADRERGGAQRWDGSAALQKAVATMIGRGTHDVGAMAILC